MSAIAVRLRGRRLRLARLPVLPAIAGLVLVLFAVVALAAPLIAPHPPDAVDYGSVFAGSSGAHPLGTDANGRDLLSRLMYGARVALLAPLIVALASAALGSLLAIAAAWRGGLADAFTSRLIDILFAFPGLLIAILAAATFGAGIRTAVIALIVAYVPLTARLVRSEALRQRRMPYIEACEVQGQSGPRIALRHLAPSLLPLIIAQATISFGYATIDFAALSYLGVGVQPPQSDWGAMVAAGQSNIVAGHPQESLYAGACLVLAVVAVTIVGDYLRTTWSLRGERA
jgi:peptide/nickel transport system permease protein